MYPLYVTKKLFIYTYTCIYYIKIMKYLDFDLGEKLVLKMGWGKNYGKVYTNALS